MDDFNGEDWFDVMFSNGDFNQVGGAAGITDGELDDRITVVEDGRKYSPKYKIHFNRYKVTLRDLKNVEAEHIPFFIHKILSYLLERVTGSALPHHRVRICMEAASLTYPIWTPPIAKSELTVDRWMIEVERVLNSQEAFVLNHKFSVLVQIADIAAGSSYENVPEMIRKKLTKLRCVLQVKNHDSMCLARCFVLANAFLNEGNQSAEYKKVKDNPSHQRILARQLLERVGLPESELTLDALPSFSKIFPNKRIRVFGLDQGNAVIYDNKVDSLREINLLHHSSHFAVLKSLAAFFKRSYWCQKCSKGYDHRGKHRCSFTCSACSRQDCPGDNGDPRVCPDCHVTFHGADCFTHHKLGPVPGPMHKRIPICDQVQICQTCLCHVRMIREEGDQAHQCGEVMCHVCFRHVMPDHKCYMKPIHFTDEKLEAHAAARFLFFDFETYVKPDGTLCPNLATVENDEGERWLFPEDGIVGPDVTDSLCKFLFQDCHRDHIVIAHNFKSFDGIFILQWLLRHNIKVDPIMNGGKILQLLVPDFDICFKDSYSYVPSSLKKFPAVVGLDDVRKGDFPHRFNREENWNKIIPFPTKEDFDYNKKSDKDKASFDKWYEAEMEAKNGLYNFNDEFIEYCRQDTTVLRLCVHKFRDLFMEVSGGICPFTAALTIAGVCMTYLRVRCLKENCIGLIHRMEIGKNRKQSVKALKWMEWVETENRIAIQTSVAGGEKKVGKYYLDGYCEEENRAYEFNGCHWHGCPKCNHPSTIHPQRGISMELIYKEAMTREKFIRSQGMDLTVMWEHEYEAKRNQDFEFRTFVDEQAVRVPLAPRDAFKGGRVNAFKLLHNVTVDEKIHYFDVTSEYPFINKYGKYPVGHPTVIRKEFKSVDNYYGLVKCTVLPPRGLLIPVIPVEVNGKLYFPLCRACARQQVKSACSHSDSERSLSGTWCSPELMKAVTLGYKVTHIEEVWHYEETEAGLFAKYIDTFLKLKTEASGWPDNIQSETEKEAYLVDFMQHENVQLEPEKVLTNPGLRSLAKLCLNSMWGRLGMRENKLRTEYVNTPERFNELLLSGMYTVSGFDMFSEDVVVVQYKSEEEFVEVNPTVNVVIAAFTTCLARLHLYQFMEKLGSQLLYCDTDSVIFSHKPGQYLPPTGNFLGDLTSELKPDQWITSFGSLGPKCYGYQTNKGQTCIKIKGHTINGETKKQLNFETLLRILCDKSTEVIKYSNVLQRNRKLMSIYQTDATKIWRVTYDKRYIIDDEFNTLPYGY